MNGVYSGDWSKGGPNENKELAAAAERDKAEAKKFDDLFSRRVAEEEAAWRIANGDDFKSIEPRESEVAEPSPGLPILRSPLPKPLPNNQNFITANFSNLNETSATALLLDAIEKKKAELHELSESYSKKKEYNQRTRELVAQLNWLLDNARKERDAQEYEMRQITLLESGIKSELTRLQDAYAERLAMAQEREALSEQLALFEKLASERPWGEAAFKYQFEGAMQMALEKRMILGDEMGLGKTLSAIMAADLGFARKILVVTQNDIVTNFSREVGKWAADRTVIPLGMYKDRTTRHMVAEGLKSATEFVVLVNYEMWRRDQRIIELLIDLKFDTVIVDEAHNMKDEKKNNFKGVKEIVYAENLMYKCDRCEHEFTRWPNSALCPDCFKPLPKPTFNSRCSVVRAYMMTGTTFLNEPGDAFPLLHLVDRIAFPDRKTFLNRYCWQETVPSLTGSMVKKWVFRPGGENQLVRKLGNKYLRRERDILEKEGIPLPPQDIQNHFIEFEDGEYVEQRRVIKNLYRVGQVLMNESKAKGEVMSTVGILSFLTRVRQALTYPAGITLYDPSTKEIIGKCEVEESIKLDYARKLINEFVKDSNQKVVLFSQFKAPLRRLQKLLTDDGIRVAVYDGDVKQEELDAITLQADAKFTARANMKYDVLLVNYRKGATGLNFTNYSQTIVLDREWNPGKQDQSYGRTNRIGQTEGTTVHVIEVQGSLDDGLRELNQRKADMIQGFNSEANEFNLMDYLDRKLKEG